MLVTSQLRVGTGVNRVCNPTACRVPPLVVNVGFRSGQRPALGCALRIGQQAPLAPWVQLVCRSRGLGGSVDTSLCFSVGIDASGSDCGGYHDGGGNSMGVVVVVVVGIFVVFMGVEVLVTKLTLRVTEGS